MAIPVLPVVVAAPERRTIALTELRVKQQDGPRMITGYAAVFNTLSLDLGGFREMILPGAFAQTIGENDVRALFNHDANYVLGRNRAGTLRLREDENGLAIEIDLPDTQWARDLAVSVGRGDVTQMSFSFRTRKDEWLEVPGQGIVRRLMDVELFDVSLVTYPAYPATTAQARALGHDFDAVVAAIGRLQDGSANADDHALASSFAARLHLLANSGAAGCAGDGGDRGGGLELAELRRRLEAAEAQP